MKPTPGIWILGILAILSGISGIFFWLKIVEVMDALGGQGTVLWHIAQVIGCFLGAVAILTGCGLILLLSWSRPMFIGLLACSIALESFMIWIGLSWSFHGPIPWNATYSSGIPYLVFVLGVCAIFALPQVFLIRYLMRPDVKTKFQARQKTR